MSADTFLNGWKYLYLHVCVCSVRMQQEICKSSFKESFCGFWMWTSLCFTIIIVSRVKILALLILNYIKWLQWTHLIKLAYKHYRYSSKHFKSSVSGSRLRPITQRSDLFQTPISSTSSMYHVRCKCGAWSGGVSASGGVCAGTWRHQLQNTLTPYKERYWSELRTLSDILIRGNFAWSSSSSFL